MLRRSKSIGGEHPWIFITDVTAPIQPHIGDLLAASIRWMVVGALGTQGMSPGSEAKWLLTRLAYLSASIWT
jgi:hypothetical protein